MSRMFKRSYLQRVKVCQYAPKIIYFCQFIICNASLAYPPSNQHFTYRFSFAWTSAQLGNILWLFIKWFHKNQLDWNIINITYCSKRKTKKKIIPWLLKPFSFKMCYLFTTRPIMSVWEFQDKSKGNMEELIE